MTDDIIIKVENLKKSYKELVAVNQVSFEVKKGEVFTLLGLNGAGKTTTIETLEGIKKPDSGRVEIFGFDITRQPKKIKEKIGVQLQDTDFYRDLKVKEIFHQFANFYTNPMPVDELLKWADLEDKKNALVRELSGGQKRKMALALALVNRPEIIFLDEPTSGVDVKIRHSLWEAIGDLKKRGMTIFMTTHYLEEAESISDRVAIIHKGKLLAIDSPQHLIQMKSWSINIKFKTLEPLDVDTIAGKSPWFGNIKLASGFYILEVKQLEQAIIDLLGLLKEKHNRISELHAEQNSLEDIFIELTKEE
ncbi:MAG: ABC transporter ATP-binding protein [Candidatus Aminicenantes bacterium]|nr:ABC transporter ATP-binding protein [Candidatus Aminicenantes bacterium]